ncbi:ADP-ribosylglycohydrolase family protein [Dokdonella sp. MW10]|uniref:ADP-ribosylglycohydrolase family protein n=1 Tax=Dokdonella sp. MW10 TaxID=2992926 RepID=UPI003F8094B4
MDLTSRSRGCMLGGAVGDALGAPVEFMSLERIRATFGALGIVDFAPAYGKPGAITDDTQMTLFTVEGVLRGWARGSLKGIGNLPHMVWLAYQRWLTTQEETRVPSDDTGWLIAQRDLHAARAPGITCLSALREPYREGGARNDSKGCGGVMRTAPIGVMHGAEHAFAFGIACAALTHGHPTGQLPAGMLAAIVAHLVTGQGLDAALDRACQQLVTFDDHAETLAAVRLARELAASTLPSDVAIRRLGQGWIAEEALAIAIYCALVAPSFEAALVRAVNHDGDSDSTGSIAGQILGAWHGPGVIPARWLEALELRDVITQLADDLAGVRGLDFHAYGADVEAFLERYPPY